MALRTSADYRSQLAQLLPPGPAWSPDLYPLPRSVTDATAEEHARVDGRAQALLAEMFPATIRELLPDWERVMGLPDPCLTDRDSSSAERVAAVLERLSGVGRQDAPYFIELAQRFGYPDARVEQWRMPRFGRMRFGRTRFGVPENQFVWMLHLGSRLPGGVRFGSARFGERFGANPNDIVECIVRRYAPAHTQVFFDYD